MKVSLYVRFTYVTHFFINAFGILSHLRESRLWFETLKSFVICKIFKRNGNYDSRNEYISAFSYFIKYSRDWALNVCWRSQGSKVSKKKTTTTEKLGGQVYYGSTSLFIRVFLAEMHMGTKLNDAFFKCKYFIRWTVTINTSRDVGGSLLP